MAHLTGAQIGEFLEHALPDEERRMVSAHLAECDECRSQVVEVGRVVRTESTRPSRRTWAVALGAAAVLALLLVQPWEQEPGSTEVFREDVATAARASIEVVGPVADARVGEGPRFVWRSADSEAVYRFTLASETGEILHSTTTSDTLLGLPNEITFAPGQEYYWVVDALLPDGSTATTGAHPFRSQP